MRGYFKREVEKEIVNSIKQFLAVVVLGPRPCGKSTTVTRLFENSDKFIYVDLERPRDLRTIDDNREGTRLLLLGSSSPELFRQSSESLAGRVHYIEQTPFLSTEVYPTLHG